MRQINDEMGRDGLIATTKRDLKKCKWSDISSATI